MYVYSNKKIWTGDFTSSLHPFIPSFLISYSLSYRYLYLLVKITIIIVKSLTCMGSPPRMTSTKRILLIHLSIYQSCLVKYKYEKINSSKLSIKDALLP